MKLFKMDLVRGREGREVIVHAESEDQARAHVALRFTGWTIRSCVDLPGGPKHFVVADFETD